MYKKIKFFLLVSSICSFSYLKPIKESRCKWWALGVGGVTGVTSGVGTYLALSDTFKQELNVKNAAILSAVGVGSGSLVGFITYQILLSKTPVARYLNAKNIIKNIYSDDLIGSKFNSDEEFAKCITVKFGTSWPLVLARRYFESVTYRLKDAKSLLEKSYREAKKDSECIKLYNRSRELEEEVKILIELITERMSSLVCSIDYKFQVKLYETHMEEVRRREYETRERDKDRVLNYHMHASKINEKQKDRESKEKIRERELQQKEKIVENNPNIPATVNVSFN